MIAQLLFTDKTKASCGPQLAVSLNLFCMKMTCNGRILFFKQGPQRKDKFVFYFQQTPVEIAARPAACTAMKGCNEIKGSRLVRFPLIQWLTMPGICRNVLSSVQWSCKSRMQPHHCELLSPLVPILLSLSPSLLHCFNSTVFM